MLKKGFITLFPLSFIAYQFWKWNFDSKKYFLLIFFLLLLLSKAYWNFIHRPFHGLNAGFRLKAAFWNSTIKHLWIYQIILNILFVFPQYLLDDRYECTLKKFKRVIEILNNYLVPCFIQGGTENVEQKYSNIV